MLWWVCDGEHRLVREYKDKSMMCGYQEVDKAVLVTAGCEVEVMVKSYMKK